MKRLARALEAAKESRSRIGKEEAIAAALREIAADTAVPNEQKDIALATAARIAAGRTLAIEDARALGVGWALLHECAAALTGWPPWVVRASARVAGDLGEAFGLLTARLPGSTDRPGVHLSEVAALFDALAATGNRTTKRRLLDDALAKATPLEVKFLVKAIQGELRVGAQGGVVEAAIARAFDVTADDLRKAAALVTDPGELAVLASGGRLAEARLSIGRPVAYMLATPLETIASPLEPRLLVVEDKIDGVRAQIHKQGPDVRVFARGLEDVSGVFPEIALAMRFVPGSVALDGELVAFEPSSSRVRPFQALQTRLQRVSPTKQLLQDVPVTFVAYDYLADDAGVHLDKSWTERRALLERFAVERAPTQHFLLNPYEPLATSEAEADPAELTATLDRLFDVARARGQEGLVLKRIDASYDAGRRGQAWIKVKKAFATLDVVVTAAEEGHGKRAGTLSDYTFAVWTAPPSEAVGEAIDEGRHLVNVGKAFSGLSDDEIVTMGRVFERSTVEKFGGVRMVRPEVVIEVAFDGIQRSKRHKSGFALRFPRIVRFRPDKVAADADTLATVEALFQSQLQSGHREDPSGDREDPPPSLTVSRVAPPSLTVSPVATHVAAEKTGVSRSASTNASAKKVRERKKPSLPASTRQLGLFDAPQCQSAPSPPPRGKRR